MSAMDGNYRSKIDQVKSALAQESQNRQRHGDDRPTAACAGLIINSIRQAVQRPITGNDGRFSEEADGMRRAKRNAAPAETALFRKIQPDNGGGVTRVKGDCRWRTNITASLAACA